MANGKYVPVVSDVMKNTHQLRVLPAAGPAVEEELRSRRKSSYRKLFKKSYSTEYLDFVCTDQKAS